MIETEKLTYFLSILTSYSTSTVLMLTHSIGRFRFECTTLRIKSSFISDSTGCAKSVQTPNLIFDVVTLPNPC